MSKTNSNGKTTKTPKRNPYADASAIVATKKIKILVDENPKRGEAAKRFAVYKNGMTVEAALEKRLTRADIRWDIKHGYIKLA